MYRKTFKDALLEQDMANGNEGYLRRLYDILNVEFKVGTPHLPSSIRDILKNISRTGYIPVIRQKTSKNLETYEEASEKTFVGRLEERVPENPEKLKMKLLIYGGNKQQCICLLPYPKEEGYYYRVKNPDIGEVI